MKSKSTLVTTIIIILILLVSAATILHSVIFAPKEPRKVRAKCESYDSILVTWKAAKNADSYKIYRRADTDSKFKEVGSTEEKKYLDKDLDTGKRYTYRILGMKGDRDGKFSKKITAITALASPTINVSVKSGSIKITATKVPGADGYAFYRNGKLISKQKGTTFVDKNAKSDNNYLYNVRAYRYEKDSVFSGSSNQNRGKLVSISNLTAEAEKDSITIKWIGVKNYNNYHVYCDNELLTTTTATTYTMTGTTTDTPYKFKIIGESYDGVKSPPLTKSLQVETTPFTNEEAVDAACKWAVDIANDNSFSYGTGKRAHRCGCYFCGTNLWKKGSTPVNGHTYEKTYCCNPFLHAAYSHGAEDQGMLAVCRSGGSIGTSKKSYTRFGNWSSQGKPKAANLKRGDILVQKKHVAMYIGNGQLVHATGEGWGAGTIRTGSLSGVFYSKVRFVMRYTGQGSKLHYNVKYL